MKIKELIDRLTVIYNDQGDIEVEILNICCCYGSWEEPITDMNVHTGSITLI